MKRLFDLILVAIVSTVFFLPFILLCIAIYFTSEGPVIYWSSRVGRDNKIFMMPKFRSMRVTTPQVATHLLKKNVSYLTPIGSFIRKSSLDELPQLFSIIKGDMSFVGPRPALFNQYDLIKLRSDAGVHKIVPGITGWAQINGRDNISITEKVLLDIEYMHRQSLWFDLKILCLTLLKVVGCDDISH